MRRRSVSWRARLDQPRSGWWCGLGWCTSTAVFFLIVQLLGGPTSGDAVDSDISTWAVAHGQLGCAFPKGPLLIAPVYPFLSGGVAAITHVGNAVRFPTRAALGPGCDQAFAAITRWSVRADALPGTVWIGYLGWFVLAAGIVLLLRACGRGKCGWEFVTLLLVACLSPVWMCVEEFFHPEDLVALGLCLAAMACARRNAWVGAGILVALAVLSQQFALLVAVPLLVFAPVPRRVAYLTSAAATVAASLVILLVVSSRTALGAALIGTGNSGGRGTVLSELHLSGELLVFASRIVPLGLSLILAWLVLQKLGPRVLEPVPLLAVMALSLSLRLVFEQALYGYYLMAVSVMLVLLDVMGQRIRGSLVAWLLLLTLVYVDGPTTSTSVFGSVPWGNHAQETLPALVLLLALVVVALKLLRHGLRMDVAPWLALAIGSILAWPSANDPLSRHVTGPYWQIVVVSWAIFLALVPLLTMGEARSAASREDMDAAAPPLFPLTAPEKTRCAAAPAVFPHGLAFRSFFVVLTAPRNPGRHGISS